MGGIGSGEWRRLDKKSTVEQSLTVAIWDLRGRINPNSYGTIQWQSGNVKVYSIGFFVTLSDAPAISLHYRWGDGEDVKTRIPLQATPTHFGGSRWWFTCPLNAKGTPCGRRIAKLHLPPGSHHFGCRECHQLSYRSSQQAHQAARLLGRMDRNQQWIDNFLATT